MGSGFSKQKKQAKMLQMQFQEMQEKSRQQQMVGTSPQGLVEITLNGAMEMLSIKIRPECVDKEDIDTLQDLIQAAYKDAQAKVEAAAPNMGGNNLGDFSSLFG